MQGSLWSTEIAEPYAQALMSLAQERQSTERLGEDIRSILSLLEQSPDLRSLIGNPVIGEAEKKRALQEIVGGDIDGYLRSFLMLLVDKKRLVFLEPICQQFLVLLRKLNNTVLAEVTSARELNHDQRQAIIDKVKQLTHAQSVELKESVNTDLIGGVVIKVGSQVFDTSIKGQIRRLTLSLGR